MLSPASLRTPQEELGGVLGRVQLTRRPRLRTVLAIEAERKQGVADCIPWRKVAHRYSIPVQVPINRDTRRVRILRNQKNIVSNTWICSPSRLPLRSPRLPASAIPQSPCNTLASTVFCSPFPHIRTTSRVFCPDDTLHNTLTPFVHKLFTQHCQLCATPKSHAAAAAAYLRRARGLIHTQRAAQNCCCCHR